MELSDYDICNCGHERRDHHRSWFPGGGEIIEECEFEGYNETGGMTFKDGRWVEHCQLFRLDKEANHGSRTSSEE